MGEITLNVSKLLEEANATPMDLIRHGMAQGTAYRIAKDDEGNGMERKTLVALCDFFTIKLGRKITPNDILTYKTDEELKTAGSV